MSETISITASDLAGTRCGTLTCPTDLPIGDAIDRALSELNLPRYDAQGQEVIYSARLDRTAAQLFPTQKLSEADVQSDDVLRLEPEISAGSNSG